jgi:hypothetical protein
MFRELIRRAGRVLRDPGTRKADPVALEIEEAIDTIERGILQIRREMGLLEPG